MEGGWQPRAHVFSRKRRMKGRLRCVYSPHQWRDTLTGLEQPLSNPERERGQHILEQQFLEAGKPQQECTRSRLSVIFQRVQVISIVEGKCETPFKKLDQESNRQRIVAKCCSAGCCFGETRKGRRGEGVDRGERRTGVSGRGRRTWR